MHQSAPGLPCVVAPVDGAGLEHEGRQAVARHLGVHHRAVRIHAQRVAGTISALFGLSARGAVRLEERLAFFRAREVHARERVGRWRQVIDERVQRFMDPHVDHARVARRRRTGRERARRGRLIAVPVGVPRWVAQFRLFTSIGAGTGRPRAQVVEDALSGGFRIGHRAGQTGRVNGLSVGSRRTR